MSNIGRLLRDVMKGIQAFWGTGKPSSDETQLKLKICLSEDWQILWLVVVLFYAAGELSRMLSHNGACAIFTIPQLLPLVKEAIKDLGPSNNVKVSVW